MKLEEIVKKTELFAATKDVAEDIVLTVILPISCTTQVDVLDRVVQSILKQQELVLELIIVEDTVNQSIRQYLQEQVKKDKRVKLLLHERSIHSTPICFYEAYLYSKGQYFILADQNFIFHKRSFCALYTGIKNTDYDVVVGVFRNKNISWKSTKKVELRHLISNNIISSVTALISKSIFEKIGLYDPHPLMNKYFDWDMWLRIAAHYPIYQLSCLVGEKLSAQLTSESTNIVLSDYLATNIMRLDRQVELLPENFYKLKLPGEVPCKLESIFKIYLKDKKESDNFDADISDASEFFEVTTTRKICILSPKEPSPYYPFAALCGEECEVIFIEPEAAIMSHDIITADFIIINRYLLTYIDLIEKINQLAIPWVYFVDDNFTFLAKEGYIAFQSYTHNNIKKYLTTAKAVFVSTESLKEYYIKNELHSNVIVFSPIINQSLVQRSAIIREKKVRTNAIHVAMVGGDFRYASFLKIVLPAIMALSSDMPVILWSICDVPEHIRLPANLTIKKLSMQADYEQFILTLSLFGIDIVIHPYGKTNNISYKTDAVVLMSRYIHANIIVGKEPCFSYLPEESGVIRVENTKEDFYAALKQLANKRIAEEMHRKLISYCDIYYSTEKNKELLNKFLEQITPISSYVIGQRLVKMAQKFFSYVPPNNLLNKTKVILSTQGVIGFIKLTIKYCLKKTRSYLNKLIKTMLCFGKKIVYKS